MTVRDRLSSYRAPSNRAVSPCGDKHGKGVGGIGPLACPFSPPVSRPAWHLGLTGSSREVRSPVQRPAGCPGPISPWIGLCPLPPKHQVTLGELNLSGWTYLLLSLFVHFVPELTLGRDVALKLHVVCLQSSFQCRLSRPHVRPQGTGVLPRHRLWSASSGLSVGGVRDRKGGGVGFQWEGRAF